MLGPNSYLNSYYCVTSYTAIAAFTNYKAIIAIATYVDHYLSVSLACSISSFTEVQIT